MIFSSFPTFFLSIAPLLLKTISSATITHHSPSSSLLRMEENLYPCFPVLKTTAAVFIIHFVIFALLFFFFGRVISTVNYYPSIFLLLVLVRDFANPRLLTLLLDGLDCMEGAAAGTQK